MVITKRTNNWLVLEQVWLGSDLTLIRLLQFLDYTTSAWRFWTLQQFKLQDQLIIYHLWCNFGQCVHQSLAFQCNVVFFLGLLITYNIYLQYKNFLWPFNTIKYSLLGPCNISLQYNISWPFDSMQYISWIQFFFFHTRFPSKTIFLFHAIFLIKKYFSIAFLWHAIIVFFLGQLAKASPLLATLCLHR